MSASIFVCLVCAAPAGAAFPGRNGVLAVQPLSGNGLVLVGVDGRGQHRICTKVSVCGHPGRPMFSPDGRSIVFAGPAIRLIGTDGSCEDCEFGVARDPAFLASGSLVSFVSNSSIGTTVYEDGIDALRKATVPFSKSFGDLTPSDAVWSAGGKLAEVVGQRVFVGQPGHLRPVGQGSEPSWSPDGSRLVVDREGWITIVRLAGGRAQRVGLGTRPAFSPDGRWIAYIGLGDELRIVSSSGGRSRELVGVRGVAVDWQPLPANPAPCVAPPGAKVLASSDQAILMTDTSTGPGGSDEPDTAALGCLIADGRERLLERSTFNNEDDATDYPIGAVGGPYAAVLVRNVDGHYGGESEVVGAFDLRTGAKTGYGGETDGCDYGPGCDIDELVVGAGGVTAVGVNGGGASSDLLNVICASESMCLAFNGFGDIASSTDPGNGPWTPVHVAPLAGGSCPSVSLCVLYSGGSIYTSTDPTGSAPVWTATQVPVSSFLEALDCPSPDFCAAVTGAGQVLTSTNPAGGAGAWSLQDIDGTNIMEGIACPSSSACFATDWKGDLLSTSDPSGGPGAWTVRNITSTELGPITCPSSSLCLAESFTGLLVSTDPANGPWQTQGPFAFIKPACPSTTFCVRVGGAPNTISISTDPASGSWTTFAAPSGAGYLNSISCPTTTFCLASGNDDGNVLITHDPTGGTSAWTPVFADQISCPIAPNACATEKIIASDARGERVLDSSTEFEPQTGPQLAGLAITGDTVSWSHSGSAMSAELTP